MKALTVRQPYAELIAAGHKRVETRPWTTNHRGPLLIHAASATVDPWPAAMLAALDVPSTPAEWAEWGSWDESTIEPERYPLGVAVALVSLVDVVPVEHVPVTKTPGWGWVRTPRGQLIVGEHERTAGDFGAGRWAWLLADVERVEPLQLRGAPGLWGVPRKTAQQLGIAL